MPGIGRVGTAEAAVGSARKDKVQLLSNGALSDGAHQDTTCIV